MSFGALLQISLPVFVLLGIGVLFRRTGLLKPALDDSFLRLALFVFYPCLVFDVFVGNEALRRPENLLVPPLCGFFVVVMGFGVSWVVARIAGVGSGMALRTFAFTCGIQNYGYIALPITLFLFGGDAAAVLFGFSLGVEFAFWGVGVLLLRGTRDFSLRPLLSPPIVSVIFCMVLNFFGGGEWIPEWLDRAVGMLGACTVPFALLLTGALFSDYTKWEFLSRNKRVIVIALLTRLGVLPLLILGFATALPFDDLIRQVLVVQAAMSAGVAPLAVAKLYGGDMEVATKVIVSTTIAGIVTIPAWLFLGLQWIR